MYGHADRPGPALSMLRECAVTVDEILARFRGVRQTGREEWEALCAKHDDREPSLAIKVAGDKVLVHCHAGCKTPDVLAAANLTFRDLRLSSAGNGGGEPRRAQVVAAYDYVDADGTLVFQVVRYKPKTFRLRRPDGRGGWIDNVKRVNTRLPYHLDDLAGKRTVAVTEGEKDCDRLRALDIPATTNAMGAGKWTEVHTRALVKAKVENVIVFADNDEAGKEHVRKVARSCAAVGLKVKIVRFPDLPAHGDLSDWLDSGHTREQLRDLVKTAPSVTAEDLGPDGPPSPGERAANDTRPLFGIPDDYDLRDFAGKAWDLITSVNDPPTLFRFGALGWIEPDDEGRPLFRALDVPRLKHWFTQRVFVHTRDAAGVTVPATPPRELLDDLLVTPAPPLPVLARIVSTPVVTAAGLVHDTPGYDAASRVLYAPPPGFALPAAVPRQPSGVEIGAAREALEEVFADFPFVEKADCATTLAALLSVPARDFIDGPCPLILYTKPAPGTGASLCVSTIVVLATGTMPAVLTECKDEDEWRKKLTSVLRQAPAVVFLDNLRGVLDSGQLSAALTADGWEDRLLGVNELVRVPIRTVWIATGNNAVLTTEMARRTVRVKLDAEVERPWRRAADGLIDFKHPELLAWVRWERGRLVHAALTLVTAWLAAGRPEGTATLGGYERWAKILGGILSVAGIEGFLERAEDLYEEDDVETGHAKAFLSRWWQEYRDHQKPPSELLTIATHPEVGLPLAGKDDHGRLVSLGMYLGKQRGRYYDLGPDLTVSVVRDAARAGHRPLWRLRQTQRRPS